MDLAELRARAEAARTKTAAARLTPEEIEHAKLQTELDELKAEEQAAAKTRRELAGKALEETARKAAGGQYLVRFVDLGSMLPDADPSTLPGNGALVVRSPPVHPVDALKVFYAEVEARVLSLPDVYLELVCVSTVYPDVADVKHPEIGAAFRAFFETSIGHGTVTGIGDIVTDLGGVRSKATKRGRG